MADNVQTTTWLYKFVVQDDATKEFRRYITNLKQYEAELQSTADKMDATMGKAIGLRMPKGTQSFAETYRDGTRASRDYRKEIEGLNDGLLRSQTSYDQVGNALQTVNTRTWTTAEGVRRMHKEILTDTTPGVTQMRGFTKEMEDGSIKSRTFVKHLNDQADTVQRIKVLYNQAGQEMQRMVTSTATVGGTRVTTQDVINTEQFSGVPQVTAYSEQIKDGVARSKEWTASLNDQAGTVERVKVLYNQAGHELERLTTTMSTVDGVTTTTSKAISTPEVASGVRQLKAYNEATIDGVVRSKEWTRALNDSRGTMIRGVETFDAAGKTVSQYGEATWTAANGVKQTRTQVENFNKTLDEGNVLGSRFARHMVWIGQGILLWGAIGAVTDSVKEWWNVQVALNTALADFEIRTQASAGGIETYKQGILGVAQETAMKPTDLAEVAAYAPNIETLGAAAKLNRVAGGDLQNQLQWLIAQQKQFDVVAEDSGRILNAVGAGARQATIPMGQYVTMLRDAGPLAKEFGLGMEEIYVLFGVMQAATAAEGRELDYLSRSLSKLYDPGAQGDLGITTEVVMPDLTLRRRDMIDILDELNEKIKDGSLSFERLADVMGATGRRQRQLLQSVVMGWDELSASMNTALIEGADFSGMLDTKMGSMQAKTDAMGAAWQGMLATIGESDIILATIDAITNGLNAWVGILEQIEDLWVRIGVNAAKGNPFAQADMWVFEQVNKLFGDTAGGGGTTAGIGGGPTNTFGAQAVGGRGAVDIAGGQRELPSFPSMYNIPEGVSMGQIQTSMDQWTRAFEALGPQFQLFINENQKSFLIYDENTKTLREMTGFLPALQRAISENTQQLKQQDLNVGMRTVDADLGEQGGMLRQWVAYYTDYLSRLGMPQESRPQLLVGENDTFLRLWSSNEALMLALRQLTEATEDQTDVLSGMWNVPEGATMWVPIQSLFYSRDKSTGGAGGLSPDFLGGPPSTLPSQQTDWMSLPGAVDQMTVSHMSVMNMEGLEIPIPLEKPGIVGVSTGLNVVDQMLGFAESTGAKALEARQDAVVTALQSMDYVPVILKDQPTTPGKWDDLPWQLWEYGPGQHPSNVGEPGSKMTISSTEIQTPITEITTPTAKEIIGSAFMTVGAGTTVSTPMVSLLTAGMTGMPDFDTTSMESILTNMAATLIIINTSIQEQRVTPTYPTPRPPGEQELAGITPTSDDNLYDDFVHKTRTTGV